MQYLKKLSDLQRSTWVLVQPTSKQRFLTWKFLHNPMCFQNMTACPAGQAMHYFGAFLKQREVVRIEQYRIPRELLSLILQETPHQTHSRKSPQPAEGIWLCISEPETALVPEFWGGLGKLRNTQHTQSWAVSEFKEYDSHEKHWWGRSFKV